MPSGLDGNPNPIVTPERSDVLRVVADRVEQRKVPEEPLLVAIDGIDGSGKSTFGDEVATELRSRGAAVVRSTIDSFHNERSVRYARGAGSPVGFYLDSHDLDAVVELLLEPMSKGTGAYCTAVFDVELDQPVVREPVEVTGDEILVFDGIFSQRPELLGFWDYVLFLDGQSRVDLGRLGCVLAELPAPPVDVVAHVLQWRERLDRYASGQRYYVDLQDPMSTADLVIDNNNLAHPTLREPARPSA